MDEEQKQRYIAYLYKKFSIENLNEFSIQRTENMIKIICEYNYPNAYALEIQQLLRALANSPADGQKLEDYKYKSAFVYKHKVDLLCEEFDPRDPEKTFDLLRQHRNNVQATRHRLTTGI